MWFKHRAWIAVAWVLAAANLFSVWFFAGPGESGHLTGHALLAALFGLGAQHLANRKTIASGDDVTATLHEIDQRLADLDRLQSAQGRLPELEERLDFIERALVEVRNRSQLPPKKG